MSSSNKIKASVSFQPDVIEYLDRLAKEMDRDRSWLINRIVREHARRVEREEDEPRLFELSTDQALERA